MSYRIVSIDMGEGRLRHKVQYRNLLGFWCNVKYCADACGEFATFLTAWHDSFEEAYETMKYQAERKRQQKPRIVRVAEFDDDLNLVRDTGALKQETGETNA